MRLFYQRVSTELVVYGFKNASIAKFHSLVKFLCIWTRLQWSWGKTNRISWWQCLRKWWIQTKSSETLPRLSRPKSGLSWGLERLSPEWPTTGNGHICWGRSLAGGNLEQGTSEVYLLHWWHEAGRWQQELVLGFTRLYQTYRLHQLERWPTGHCGRALPGSWTFCQVDLERYLLPRSSTLHMWRLVFSQ